MIVDSIKVYSKFSELNIKCTSCGSFDHNSLKCNLINYQPIPLKIIKIFQDNSQQKRKNFMRRSKQMFHNLRDQFQLECAVSKFKKFQGSLIDDFQFKYLAVESEFDSSSCESSEICGFERSTL